MKNRFLRMAQPIFLLLALVFIALLIRSQWRELTEYSWRLHPGWLLLSALVLIASWFVEVNIWRMALTRVGGQLSYLTAVRIWFASILVRYIPGNVWQPLGMTVLAQQAGVRPAATVMSIALYQAINLLSVVPLVSLYLLRWHDQSPLLNLLGGVSTGLAWLATLGIAIFLLRPHWLTASLNWALSRLKRPTLPMSLTTGQLFRLFAVAVLDWLLWGVAFAALVFALHAFTHTEQRELLPHLLVAYPVAYAVGYLSFITPGGLAVREGVLVLLLTPFLGGVATVAALAMRLWQVMWEVIVAGLVAIAPRFTGHAAVRIKDVG